MEQPSTDDQQNGKPQDNEGFTLPIEWYVPETTIARYATNLTIQRTEHEFVISFFEAPPPLLIGTPEEIRASLEQQGAVRATCVARVIVAPGRMPDFVRVLQGSLQASLDQQAESA